MMKIKYIIILLVPAILLAQGSFRRQKIDRLAVSTESQITMEDTVRLDTLTGDTVPFLNASKDLTSSSVTPTELGYVSGVTSSIQTQIDGKEPILTKGDLTETGSSILTVTGGTGAVIGSGVTLEVQQASSLASGYLTNTDWSLFNGKQDTISGTANEIDVIANVVSIVDNPVFSGLESVTLPAGADGDRPSSPVNGMIRYNTTSSSFEGYQAGAWGELGGGGGVGGSRLQLISDPSFEEGVTEGSCTGCTATQDTTDKLGTDNNLASLKMAFSAASGDYTLTKSTSAQYSNVAGVVSAWIKTSASDCHFDELVDGTQSQTVAIGSSDAWKQYIINGTTGTTSYGWRIRCDTAITDDVFVDETFAGAAEPDTFDIGTASLWGSGKWEYTAAVCNWAVSSSTFASPAADADCDTPELKGNYTQVASTNIPALKFSYLKAGSYKIIAKTSRMYKNTSVSNNCGVRFFDGTNASSPMQYGTTGATETQNPVVVGQFDYTTDQNDITFELQFLANSGGNCGIYLSDSANYNGMEISVYHYPSPQKVVAAKCDGLECENEFSARITSGAVVTSESTDFIASAATGASCQVDVTFQSGIFNTVPAITCTTESSAQTCGVTNESTTGFTYTTWDVVYVEGCNRQDVSINVSRQGSDYNQFDQRFIPVVDEFNTEWTDYAPTLVGFGSTTNDNFKYRRVGDSMEIQGYFTTGTTTATEAQVPLPNGHVIDSDKVSTIALVGNLMIDSQSSQYQRTVLATGGDSFLNFGLYNNTTANGLNPQNGSTLITLSGITVSFYAKVPIAGWTAGKTAFIGNLTPKEFVQTPGSTLPVVYSLKFGGASLGTNCTSSPCTILTENNNWVDSVTRSTTGTYTVNFTSGTFSQVPVCTCSSFSHGITGRMACGSYVITTSSMVLNTADTSDTMRDTENNIICHGVQ